MSRASVNVNSRNKKIPCSAVYRNLSVGKKQPRRLSLLLKQFGGLGKYGIRPKKTCVSGQTVSPKLMRPCGFFFFFFFFLLVGFLNSGKRSEMVLVGMKGTRYELNISTFYS